MNYNIKNFPKAGWLLPGEEPIEWEENVEKWIKGFEKELREQKKYFTDNFKFLEIVRQAHIEMIDQILGEDQ